MPINDDDLLAAISAGVDSEGAPAAATTPEESTNDEADAGSDAATGDDTNADGASRSEAGGGDGAADTPDESVPADEAAADDDAATGEGVGPDGKPLAKDGAKPGADEIDPATGKPYTPEQVEARKKEKEQEEFRKNQVEDPINAPIPKYLKATTQERMTKLVGIAKDLTAKHAAAQRDRDEIVGMIVDTGANAAQYTQALQYLKMVNSGDPQQIKAAIGVMQAELAALSRMSGTPVAGVDLLADHPDLKAAVDAKQITRELADEIAAGREHRNVQAQNSRAVQQNNEQAQAEHNAGVQALNQIGAELAKSDPNYRVKAQAVLAQIGDQMKQLRPSQWAQTFLVAYSTYKPPVAPRAAAPPARKVPVVPKNQPLRGNNPSGGQQKAPGSLEDAINMGIAAGTRR